MNEIMTGGFVKPYPQEELGGRLGLTSIDVAKAIGVVHRDLIRDMDRREYLRRLLDSGFSIALFGSNRKGPGRKGKIYAFDVEAAKVIVAQSRTETGLGYVRYLISCERAIEEQVPKLMARIAELEEERAEKGSKPRRWSLLAGYTEQRNLFGEMVRIPVVRDLRLSDMTDEERRRWEASHLTKQTEGMNRKAHKLLDGEVKPGRGTLAIAEATNEPRRIGAKA